MEEDSAPYISGEDEDEGNCSTEDGSQHEKSHLDSNDDGEDDVVEIMGPKRGKIAASQSQVRKKKVQVTTAQEDGSGSEGDDNGKTESD